MDILSDVVFLAVAAIFFALSFMLINAFGNLMGEPTPTPQATQERQQ